MTTKTFTAQPGDFWEKSIPGAGTPSVYLWRDGSMYGFWHTIWMCKQVLRTGRQPREDRRIPASEAHALIRKLHPDCVIDTQSTLPKPEAFEQQTLLEVLRNLAKDSQWSGTLNDVQRTLLELDARLTALENRCPPTASENPPSTTPTAKPVSPPSSGKSHGSASPSSSSPSPTSSTTSPTADLDLSDDGIVRAWIASNESPEAFAMRVRDQARREGRRAACAELRKRLLDVDCRSDSHIKAITDTYAKENA